MSSGNKKTNKGGNPAPLGGALLNLERIPGLAPKFANKLGKSAVAFTVSYTTEGVSVEVMSLLGARAQTLEEAEEVSLVEYERRVALANTPSPTEKLNALRRKFELRLNIEFPSVGPSSGSDEHIQAWLGTLPFAQRRALLMSQKDFDKSYKDGFRA